jgi:ABC-type ATPase with predicted acetyltransferase domain
MSLISRVIVHPKYRTIGLGVKLVHDTLPLAGTSFVEMVAVMAKYNPFAERAGMQRIAEESPSKQAMKISEQLSSLGFDLQFLRSEDYVRKKVENLSEEQLVTLKEAFIKNVHPRLVKEFVSNTNAAFGKKSTYLKGIKDANASKIVKLIKIVGLLLQSKVYLFWRNGSL